MCPWFLTEAQFERLRQQLKNYDDTVQEKNKQLRRLAGKKVAECVAGHKIVLEVQKFGRVKIFYRKKKITGTPSKCIYCGGPIIRIEDIPPHPKYEEYARRFDELLRSLEEDITQLIEPHPLWSLWLRYVRGVGPIGAARLIVILEYYRNVLRGPSGLFKLTGYCLVHYCPRCNIVQWGARGDVVLCPKCRQPMVKKVPGKWLKGGTGYSTEFKGYVSKVVQMIANKGLEALRDFLEGKKPLRNPEDMGFYAVHFWWKFCTTFEKKYPTYEQKEKNLDRALAQAARDAYNAARISTGMLLLQHAWHIVYALKFTEHARRVPPECKVWVVRFKPGTVFIPPLVDVPLDEMRSHELYVELSKSDEKILEKVQTAVVEYQARLDYVVEKYPKIVEMLKKRSKAREELAEQGVAVTPEEVESAS